MPTTKYTFEQTKWPLKFVFCVARGEWASCESREVNVWVFVNMVQLNNVRWSQQLITNFLYMWRFIYVYACVWACHVCAFMAIKSVMRAPCGNLQASSQSRIDNWATVNCWQPKKSTHATWINYAIFCAVVNGEL